MPVVHPGRFREALEPAPSTRFLEFLSVALLAVILSGTGAGYYLWAEQQKNLRREMREAIDAQDCGAMLRLFRRGAPAQVTGKLGVTPLVVALWQKDREVAFLALDRGADVNAGGSQTPVIIWALQDDQLLRRVIETGANVDARDHDGVTPLMWAARGQSLQTVQLLLRHGAKVNLQSTDGTTALMETLMLERADVAECLLSQGADTQIRDGWGHTALDQLRENRKMIQRWLSHPSNPKEWKESLRESLWKLRLVEHLLKAHAPRSGKP